MNGIETKLAVLEEKIIAIENGFNRHISKVDEMDDSIHEIERKVDLININIDNHIKTLTASISGEITLVKSKIENHEKMHDTKSEVRSTMFTRIAAIIGIIFGAVSVGFTLFMGSLKLAALLIK